MSCPVLSCPHTSLLAALTPTPTPIQGTAWCRSKKEGREGGRKETSHTQNKQQYSAMHTIRSLFASFIRSFIHWDHKRQTRLAPRRTRSRSATRRKIMHNSRPAAGHALTSAQRTAPRLSTRRTAPRLCAVDYIITLAPFLLLVSSRPSCPANARPTDSPNNTTQQHDTTQTHNDSFQKLSTLSPRRWRMCMQNI